MNVYVENFGPYNFTNSPQTVAVYKDLSVAPQITTQPTNQLGYIGMSATFTVVATGTPLSYQWYNADTGLAISGATSAMYTINNLTAAMAGSRYYCQVYNTAGIVNSNIVTLWVDAAPFVVIVNPTSQPIVLPLVTGATYNITTTISTSAGTVQWYSDATGVTSTTAPTGVTASIPGTTGTGRVLTITVATDTPVGTYYFRVIVANVQSVVCSLTVSQRN